MDTTILSLDSDSTSPKERQHAAWSAGDYARIGATLQIVGEELAEAVAAPPGSRVLDVAAGNGNATLAFARRFCDVTSTDYVKALLDRGRERAEAERFDVTFRTADAERLPFRNDAFDAVVSTFGVMFTPDQDAASSELVRVCRSGGRIGLACWTPDGVIGALFRVLGKHVPPPRGHRSPARWGTDAWLREQFGHAARSVSTCTKEFWFVHHSPEAFIEYFRTFYGPVQKAFERLGPGQQRELELDMLNLLRRFDRATDGTMRVPGEYLEIVITKS